ncbi:hypothetical protein WG66_002476 [Moniliophthora roreri]|nr:hypothetical protein WG66_002476 [Moniliophthora roreri]
MVGGKTSLTVATMRRTTLVPNSSGVCHPCIVVGGHGDNIHLSVKCRCAPMYLWTSLLEAL